MPGRLALTSVQACEKGTQSLVLWNTEGGEGSFVVPLLCKSYRCRRCGPYVGALDLSRIKAGTGSRAWWLYVVLTFRPSDFDCSWSAYRAAYRLWDKRLRRRFEREFGRLDYVQTWERHTTGAHWPHLNLLISSPKLREAVEGAGWEWRHDANAGHGVGRQCKFPKWRPWIARAAPACGFGERVWCEIIDDTDTMAAYLAKAAHDVGAARWKHGDQTPVGAPSHFRRLRASRGLLPARKRGDGALTALVVRVPPDEVPVVLDHTTGEVIGIDPEWIAFEVEKARIARRLGRDDSEPCRFET